MIDKATFEAHVRAEADERYPTQEAEREADRDLFATLNNEQNMRQAAYIAARMEHEWPLVEALQHCVGWAWRCGDIDPSGSMQIAAQEHAVMADSALSPYKPNPIER